MAKNAEHVVKNTHFAKACRSSKKTHDIIDSREEVFYTNMVSASSSPDCAFGNLLLGPHINTMCTCLIQDWFKVIDSCFTYLFIYLTQFLSFTLSKARCVPEVLKEELSLTEICKISKKVTKPSEWVNSLVITEKPKSGKLRICCDPKALNGAILWLHCPMITTDVATVDLVDALYFSILDCTHGYWSVKLRQECVKPTTPVCHLDST